MKPQGILADNFRKTSRAKSPDETKLRRANLRKLERDVARYEKRFGGPQSTGAFVPREEAREALAVARRYYEELARERAGG